MENNPEMEAVKAFWSGVASFWRSFWKKAATQGMLVMTLIAMIIGLVLWVDNRNKEIRQQRMEFKAEMADLRSEYRHEISILKFAIDSLREGLDDCNEARIKAEAQNAALLEVVKRKR